jgi:hypothetical protein
VTRSNAPSSPRFDFASPSFPWLLLAILSGILFLLAMFAHWRSSEVGTQVQVPMFYDAHYLFPRPWTQEQSAPGIPDPAPIAIYGQNSVSQSFIAGSDNLSRISFPLSGPGNEIVTAVLSDEDGGVRQADIPLTSSANPQEYALSFPAITNSNNRQFTLMLSAPLATPDQPVMVYTVGGDRLGNSLRLNEFIRPGNLSIATYSKAFPGLWWFDALGEQLLPSVFRLRLQQFKPAPFKGDLFTWLLVVTIGLSAVLLVLASPALQTGVKSFWHRLARALGWFLVLLVGSLLFWQVGSGRVQLFPGAHDVMVESTIREFPITGELEFRLVADLTADLWTAVREPEARFISTGTFSDFPTINVPADSKIAYSFIIPPGSYLRLAEAVQGEGAINFVVKVNDQILFEKEVAAQEDSLPADLSWQELDLEPWTGQGVVLTLETSAQNGAPRGLWFMPQILSDAPWLLTDLPNQYLPLGTRFGETVELLGLTLDDSLLQTNGQLAVQLLWRPLQANNPYGTIFVHLIDSNNQLVAQHDAPPVYGAYPFSIWQPGKIVEDTHVLQVDPEILSSEPYHLEIGIYDPDSLQRWTAENADGSLGEANVAILELPSEVLP